MGVRFEYDCFVCCGGAADMITTSRMVGSPRRAQQGREGRLLRYTEVVDS